MFESSHDKYIGKTNKQTNKQTNKLKYYIFVSSEAFGTHDRHAGSISW